MGTTTPGALPYPEPTDPVAAGAANFKALADKVDLWTLHSFANVAARDAWAAPPAGALCMTLDTGMIWRRMAAGWSHLLAKSGNVAGPGGNYASGTDFTGTGVIAADPGPRVLSFVYNGLVTGVSGQLDIVAMLAGAGVSQYRHPGGTATAQVNFARAGIPIAAGAAPTLTIRNTGSTVTLYADPLLHHLSWEIHPA